MAGMSTLPYSRRWRLPPPYLSGSEPMEAAGILEEMGGPMGLLLWQTARDATLWATTPAERREGLFHPDAEPRRLADVLSVGDAVESIEEPLRALAALLSHPADVAPEAVMLACNRISQWAESREMIRSALAYAQASALSMPGSARSALQVGRLARRVAEHARAEGWLQRAVVLARQEGDRLTHAFGYSALGNLYKMRGNMPAAERHHLRALRIARRHSLAGREAAAVHDLFVICAETGRLPEAITYARGAVTAYGPRHERLPALAHDIAVLWVENGEFGRALPVLLSVWPHLAPGDRVLGLTNAARAAGALRDQTTYAECHARSLAIIDAAESREHHAVAVLNLARGAVGLGELDLGRRLADRATALAVQAGEHKISFGAEALLQQIDANRSAITSPPLPAPASEPTEADESADALVGELVACFSG